MKFELAEIHRTETSIKPPSSLQVFPALPRIPAGKSEQATALWAASRRLTARARPIPDLKIPSLEF